MTKTRTAPADILTSSNSIPEWAKRTGLSESTIRRMIASGKLRAYRFGPRVIRIAEADLMAAFEQINPTGYELAHA